MSVHNINAVKTEATVNHIKKLETLLFSVEIGQAALRKH
jgi:hypothetical protein